MIVRSHVEVQKRYETLVGDGMAPKLAEVLATGKFPGTRTDREFLEGHCNGSQFERTPWIGDGYKARAEQSGVSTNGKVYLSGLASFPGDPAAWVSDRSDVLRVAREKGLTVHGSVHYDPGEPGPPERVAIDPRLVEAEVQDVLAENPDADVEEVRERVIELRTGQVDPNPSLVSEPPQEAFTDD